LKGDSVPTIDFGDFKKAWEVRRACFDGYIDVESVKPIFKPDTNVEAAISRATVLLLLTQIMPDELAEFMDHGQPSDAFLAAFARMPLVEGDEINVGELLKTFTKLMFETYMSCSHLLVWRKVPCIAVPSVIFSGRSGGDKLSRLDAVQIVCRGANNKWKRSLIS
jgi:hypothetical protein